MLTGWALHATTALCFAALMATALAVVRLFRGPTGADRIVALDIFLAAAIALCVAAALWSGRTVYLDVGMGLAVCAFVATIGWAQLLEQGAQWEAARHDASAQPTADLEALSATQIELAQTAGGQEALKP